VLNLTSAIDLWTVQQMTY